ncbi:MAG: 1-acyl-sn-glycerol-3-phosphate acyltransferase [Candidatus Thiodiazotropha sp.]
MTPSVVSNEMTIQQHDKSDQRESGVTSDALLDVVQGLIDETPDTSHIKNGLNLESRLEHDLGFNSLARAELISRINKTFSIILPDEALLAETPRALLMLTSQAAGMTEANAPIVHREQPAGGVALPSAASTLMEVLAWHLDHQPERTHIFCYGTHDQPAEMSYRDLWQGATRVACAVQVVNEEDRPLPDRKEGRLEFQGPSATSGYFGNPDASARLFRDSWLDTGDRAYLADGDIYITGRIKEMIIRGGRNIYPYELELQLGELEGIRKGCVAAFPGTDSATGSERLVVLAESREQDPQRREALRQAIRDKTIDLLSMPPDDLLLAPPHTILKTSSGKLRRGAMRILYEQGRLGRGQRPLPLQILSLLLSGLTQRIHRIRRGVSRYLFAGYAWILFYGLVPLVWISVVLLPRLSWRWSLIHNAIRLLRTLTATPLQVEGLEHLPPADHPVILVANHSSYLDTLALIDGIPRDFVYVAKQELAEKFYSRLFLQRLETLFIERFDTRRSAMATESFVARLTTDRSLVIYPEGTFRTEPGLLPFQMGAFVSAAQAGVPILPVTIRGTRAILKSDSSFPHHGAVRIVISPPIEPEGNDWSEAVRLQLAAKEVIANHYAD